MWMLVSWVRVAVDSAVAIAAAAAAVVVVVVVVVAVGINAGLEDVLFADPVRALLRAEMRAHPWYLSWFRLFVCWYACTPVFLSLC